MKCATLPHLTVIAAMHIVAVFKYSSNINVCFQTVCLVPCSADTEIDRRTRKAHFGGERVNKFKEVLVEAAKSSGIHTYLGVRHCF